MTAKERIELKESQTLYKKVGRKYVRASDNCAYDGLREGWWLVKVDEYSTSIRQQVYPAKAELTAAARDKEDQLLNIIREASEARPSSRPITPEALKDWKKFVKKHGAEFSSLEFPSFAGNAEKIIELLLK